MPTIAHIQVQRIAVDLHELLMSTSIFDDHEEERDFWLENTELLDEKEKKSFAAILMDNEQKVESLRAEHARQVSQVNSLSFSKLKLILGKKKKLLVETTEAREHAYEEDLVGAREE
jgi:hypothetical protein